MFFRRQRFDNYGASPLKWIIRILILFAIIFGVYKWYGRPAPQMANLGTYNNIQAKMHQKVQLNGNLVKPDQSVFPSNARSQSVIQPVLTDVGQVQYNNAGAYIVNNNQASFKTVKPYGRPWAQNHVDKEGRAAIGDAYLTQQARQYQSRQQTNNGANSWKPMGYHQKMNLTPPYTFAYNRGHLLGYALIGNIRGFNASEHNRQNIVTQTMWANQAGDPNNTGQNYYEGIVRQALDQGKFVRYQVRALYGKSYEQVPRAFQIQAKSSDNSINFNVLVPNTQNNIQINYTTGNVTPSH